MWYSAMERRLANPVGLPEGLVAKYHSLAGANSKKLLATICSPLQLRLKRGILSPPRFSLLKEFMLDPDMWLGGSLGLKSKHWFGF